MANGFQQCGKWLMRELRSWSKRRHGNLEAKIKKGKNKLAVILEEYGMGDTYMAE